MNGDEVAIVGMAGRFPGAGDLATFWRQLLDAVDSADQPTPGVTDFDPALFGFTVDEAARTDPQHRLFLETCWEALEDSGHDPGQLTVPVGVFGSASTNQYQFLQLRAGLPPVPYQSADHLPTQVAYRLGLTGPAVAVQTACSGSLVAVCLAAQSLNDFRCDLAIAGGANVNLPGYPHANDGLISPDGVCRAFDAAGQGAGFASGAGAVVLRRLDDAVADGDHIYAVLRGWAVTNDGANRAGFAAPGVDGQTAAVAEALAVAELTPAEVGMIEAHGSGTRLGDAIEVAALRRLYQDLPRPVALGSVKTNIGYLDAACGITGLLKAALAVGHGMIPASLHFREPNPEIDFGPFVVPTKTGPWPDEGGADQPRIAGVSAFGVGGTNAHLLVAQPPSAVASAARSGVMEAGERYQLPLSAASPAALRQLASRLHAHLAQHRPALRDVAHTLTVGRARLAHQTSIDCGDLAEALTGLAALAAGAAASEPNQPAAVPVGDEPVAANGADRPTGRRIPLPTYPFERQRCWLDAVAVPR